MNTLWVIYSHIDIKGEICSRTNIVRVVLRKKENLYKKSVAALEVTRNSLISGNKKQPIYQFSLRPLLTSPPEDHFDQSGCR
jgi:hypothetical protein